MSEKEIGSPVTDILSLAVTPFIGLSLAKGQAVANVAAGDALGESNSTLTAANWVWIVLGVLLWILSLIGIYSYFI